MQLFFEFYSTKPCRSKWRVRSVASEKLTTISPAYRQVIVLSLVGVVFKRFKQPSSYSRNTVFKEDDLIF